MAGRDIAKMTTCLVTHTRDALGQLSVFKNRGSALLLSVRSQGRTRSGGGTLVRQQQSKALLSPSLAWATNTRCYRLGVSIPISR